MHELAHKLMHTAVRGEALAFKSFEFTGAVRITIVMVARLFVYILISKRNSCLEKRWCLDVCEFANGY